MPSRQGSTGPRVGAAGAWRSPSSCLGRVCGPDGTGSKQLAVRHPVKTMEYCESGGSSARRRALLLDGLVTRAQDPHPGDAAALGAVVGLLLDQVVAAGAVYAHPVGDMLALRHLAGADRAQLQNVGPGAEPVLEDDLLGHLPAGGGLPVPPGRQGLEV